MDSITEETLGANLIKLDELNTKNKFLVDCLQNKNDGHQILRDNILYYLKRDINGESSRLEKHSDHSQLINNIMGILKRPTFVKKYPIAPRSSNEIFDSLFMHYIPLKKGSSPYSTGGWNYLKYNTQQTELAIMLYAIITTGLNLEVIKKWRWDYDGTPWYENFDIKLGLDSGVNTSEAQVVLIGTKNKGQKRNPKPIACPIKLNTPLFRYLTFLDKIREPGREFIFGTGTAWNSDSLRGFLAHYDVKDDSGNPMVGFDSKKCRKIYAGHKLMDLLKDVKSPYELVSKMKVALDHGNFDTTFFSYLLKSGSANLVLNSAIVSLTSDMLNKAISFAGNIHSDTSQRNEKNERYLCDCADPTKPSHDIPIHKKCTRYDLCLGCERSEVYAEHIPNILFRIIQIEEYKMANTMLTSSILDDRLMIAKDTIERFRVQHPRGELLIETSYETVNEALRKGEILLPPIIQH